MAALLTTFTSTRIEISSSFIFYKIQCSIEELNYVHLDTQTLIHKLSKEKTGGIQV